MNVQHFSPGITSTLAVTTTTGRVALSGIGENVEIQNIGTVTMFVKLGDSAVTAAITDYPIQSGHSKLITRAPGVTHIAALTGTGTATLYATIGEGS